MTTLKTALLFRETGNVSVKATVMLVNLLND